MTYRILTATAIVHAICSGVWGQGTTVDLRTQARNVDFSGAPQTKSSKAGTVLPATCSTGETFFKIDAPAGLNLYGCKPDNVWSLLSGGTSSLPPVAGAEGKVLTYDGSAPQWSALAGDVQGTPGANSVHGLQGRSMSSAAPFNNDVLTWNEDSSQWQPAGASVQAGSGINVAANSISMDDAVVPLYYTGSGAPQFPCTAGRDYYVDLVSVNLYFCGAVNVWQAVSKTSPLLSAGDIVSGTLALARGGTQADLSATGGAGQFLKQSSTGAAVTVGAIASTDLPTHTHAATDVTSGTLALARGGTQTDLSATGGAGQFLKQSSTGAAVTVGAIASTDLPTHTHAATDVTSGTLALARGGTLTDLSATGGAGQFLKQSSTGAAVTVGAIASTDLPIAHSRRHRRHQRDAGAGSRRHPGRSERHRRRRTVPQTIIHRRGRHGRRDCFYRSADTHSRRHRRHQREVGTGSRRHQPERVAGRHLRSSQLFRHGAGIRGECVRKRRRNILPAGQQRSWLCFPVWRRAGGGLR